MFSNMYRLACPTAGGSTKHLLPKHIWIKVNRSTNGINIRASNSVRLCHSGKHLGPRCITQDHVRLSVKQGSLSLQLCTRQFHTSGRRQAFPPLFYAVFSYAAKFGVALSGRKWRNWLAKQPESVQKKHRRGIKAFFTVLGLALATFSWFYYKAHQVLSPITGKTKFITVTREQYLKVADFQTENYLEDYKDKMVPATDPIYKAVLEVAQRLVKANQDLPGMANHKWQIYIVNDEQKNAFVLPNGVIFVFTGLLNFMENPDQFAVVLGHEMSHALLLHAAQNLSFSQFIDWFIIFGMALIWLFLPNDGIAVVANYFYNKVMDLSVHMPYSRELEEEADYVGLQIAAKACFDMREGSVFWTRMTIAGDLKGEERMPEWLSTHPTHQNRVNRINQLIPKAIKLRDSCKCPRLPETDPRARVLQQREATDHVLRALGAKANMKSIEKTKVQRPVLVTNVEKIPTATKF